MMKKIISNLILIIFGLLISSQVLAKSEVTDTIYPSGKWMITIKENGIGKMKAELHIVYSEKHKKYFGHIKPPRKFGEEPAILQNIQYNKQENKLTFLTYLSTKIEVELIFKGNTFDGKSIDGNTILKGKKIGELTPNNNIQIYEPYTRTKIPDNINCLYFEDGNLNANTVLLIVQGGPYQYVEKWPFFNSWKEKLHLVYVQQAQSLNPSFWTAEDSDITYEDVYAENIISTEIIHRVIQHFKKQNKTVLIWGASYGAALLHEYIAQYGIEADAMSISAGQLDTEQEAANGRKQTCCDFKYVDGIKQIDYDAISEANKVLAYLYNTMASRKYTKVLANTDLSKLVVYQYGKVDKVVGAMDKNEIDFLEKKGVSVIGYPVGHDKTMSPKNISIAIEKMLEFVSVK